MPVGCPPKTRVLGVAVTGSAGSAGGTGRAFAFTGCSATRC